MYYTHVAQRELVYAIYNQVAMHILAYDTRVAMHIVMYATQNSEYKYIRLV